MTYAEPAAPLVDVVIEVPRGSFLKRGSSGRIDFVSPLPCPFNYGAVPGLLGLEGDLLDALVLRFFAFYARCKALLNAMRRRPGRNACEGWIDTERALARARPLPSGWQGPDIRF